MTYAEKLAASIEKPFFAEWDREEDTLGHTIENRDALTQIFRTLTDSLAKLGATADEKSKLAAFQVAVEALNDLNDETGVIETDEREQLCELINAVTTAAGLDPTKYGDGEGPASIWRDW